MDRLGRKILLGVLPVSMVAFATYAYWRGTEEEQAAVVNHTLKNLIQCHENKTYNYSFSYSSTGYYQSLLNPNDRSDIDMSIAGKMTLTCIESSSRTYKVEFFDIKQRANLGRFGSYDIQLNQPVYFSRSASGIISDIILSPGTERLTRNFIRDFLSHQSIELKMSQKDWQTVEVDLNGQYRSSYGIAENQKISKQRISYSSHNKDSNIRKTTLPHKVDILDSRTEFNFKDSQIDELTSNLAIQIKNQDQTIGETATSVSLTLIGSKRSKPSDSLNSFKKLVKKEENHTDLVATDSHARMKSEVQKRELAGETWDSLLPQLLEGKKDNLTSLYLKLRALFYLHPETMAHALDYLLNIDNSQSQFGVVVMALIWVGNQEAQKYLIEATHGHQDKKSKIALLGQAGMFEKPTTMLDQEIREIRDVTADIDIKQSARFALGNNARTIKETENDRYSESLKEALSLVISCQGYVACVNALHVLGNFGAKESIPIAKKFLKHTQAGIRSAAVSALRFVDCVEAEAIILRTLTEDQSDVVRTQAAVELGFRYPSLESIATQQKRLFQETSERIRVQIVANLGQDLKKFPDIGQNLKKVRQEDISETVRDKADAVLTQNGVI